MYVYAGIDEAGYGPMYGPLVVGCSVLVLPDRPSDAKPPAMWELLKPAVCDRLRGRNGRIAINDSKKLTTKAAGIKHLELGLLAFLGTDNTSNPPDHVGDWLDLIGETRHNAAGEEGLDNLPWYKPCEDRPWQTLPRASTKDEVTLATGMLGRACRDAGVRFAGYQAQVVYEDHFNQRVALTRSKASVSFTAVARHLVQLMNSFGDHHPHVAVDRQSGRVRYRELLAQVFDGCAIDVLGENDRISAYRVKKKSSKQMTISFIVEAETHHMPVALASMTAKYTRELLMQRFNAYFTAIAPQTAPTAGYGQDANRWRDEVITLLAGAGIDHQRLRRLA